QTVDEKPTPNDPEIGKILPGSVEPTEFDVAEVKFTPPDQTNQNFRIQPSGRVDIEGFDLKFIMQQLWQLTDEMLIAAPKWLGEKKLPIIAKAPPAAMINTQNAPPVDVNTLITMIQNVITDRFKMKYHMEERPLNAFTLSAAKPKM